MEDRDEEQNEAPTAQEVSARLLHLDTHPFMGPDGIHPKVPRELVKELAKPLSIIYQQSWLTGEVPEDGRLVTVMSTYKKGRKEDLGNYRPVSLHVGKSMEQVTLSTVTRHVQDDQGIGPRQRGAERGRSRLTNPISFYDKATR